MVRSDILTTMPFLSLSVAEAAFDVGKGFALWSPKFTNKRCPADVLFTVACWLQYARESAALPPQDRLDDGGFQQTVIAPDSFLRFTDPVIQASILRAARDGELDYRAATAVSARAGEILSKFISLKEDSVLEFLMALAFHRMKLCDPDIHRIVDVATQELGTDERVMSLIALIQQQLPGR
jgi:hypothetical protein